MCFSATSWLDFSKSALADTCIGNEWHVATPRVSTWLLMKCAVTSHWRRLWLELVILQLGGDPRKRTCRCFFSRWGSKRGFIFFFYYPIKKINYHICRYLLSNIQVICSVSRCSLRREIYLSLIHWGCHLGESERDDRQISAKINWKFWMMYVVNRMEDMDTTCPIYINCYLSLRTVHLRASSVQLFL